MLEFFKNILKKALRYTPLDETERVRQAIERVDVEALPYCPSFEGDLLFSLIRENKSEKCLETGFHTGSTALYLAAAIADHNGHVTSICLDDDETVERGLNLLDREGYTDNHRLIRQNSNKALPELYLSGEQFDFVFMDGWKTFDHMVFEVYLLNQMLTRGGIISFDDSYMPSVRKVISLLKRYYGYQEVDYAAHNQSLSLRLYQILTRRSFHRPYRALKKTSATEDQRPFQDWKFYRRL
jgi:predicted O-methyltransferase YrrM